MGGDSAPAGDRAAALELPEEVAVEAHRAAWALDAAAGGGDDDVAGHAGTLRDAHLHHLGALSGAFTFDDLWPRSLYIPSEADPGAHWPFPAPDDHRYSHEWTTPGDANTASRATGAISAFAEVVDPNSRTVRAEAGVGVRFTPSVSLGVVEVSPDLAASGTLRWKLDVFPTVVAGSVRVTASIVVAVWHEIPGGFDLVGHTTTTIADSGWRDQSHGAELRGFGRQARPREVLGRFLVQGGRTYVAGIVARVSGSSTLTDSQGRPVPAPAAGTFKVWGQLNAAVRAMWVERGTTYIA